MAGSPGVEALMVICELPIGVLTDVLTLKVSELGFPFVGATEFAGWNWQLAPCGRPEHDSVTEPVKEPRAETSRATGEVVLPGATLTLFGEGDPRLKSTMCNVSEKSWVTVAESVPTA